MFDCWFAGFSVGFPFSVGVPFERIVSHVLLISFVLLDIGFALCTKYA